MMILFPINLKMKRNTDFPKMIIRMGGKVSGTEALVTEIINQFAECAKLFKGKPMTQVLLFRPKQDEVFVISMQLKFETRRQMNEFFNFIANQMMGGS